MANMNEEWYRRNRGRVGVDDATAGLHSDTAAFLTTEDYMEDYRSIPLELRTGHTVYTRGADG